MGPKKVGQSVGRSSCLQKAPPPESFPKCTLVSRVLDLPLVRCISIGSPLCILNTTAHVPVPQTSLIRPHININHGAGPCRPTHTLCTHTQPCPKSPRCYSSSLSSSFIAFIPIPYCSLSEIKFGPMKRTRMRTKLLISAITPPSKFIDLERTKYLLPAPPSFRTALSQISSNFSSPSSYLFIKEGRSHLVITLSSSTVCS